MGIGRRAAQQRRAFDLKTVPTREVKVESSQKKGMRGEKGSWAESIEQREGNLGLVLDLRLIQQGEGNLGLVFDLRLKIVKSWEVELV